MAAATWSWACRSLLVSMHQVSTAGVAWLSVWENRPIVDAVIRSAPCLDDRSLTPWTGSPSSPQSLPPVLEDAAHAGARKSGGLEFVGRGRGFTDMHPEA